MCFAIPLKISKITDGKAQMEDGRVVKLGSIKNIKIGDYLEVYADLAVTKLTAKDALNIRKLIKKTL